MKHLRRFNESKTIKVYSHNIGDVVLREVSKLGNNADLNHIDTSEVTTMSELFFAKPFNGDISQWDVGNVRSMRGVFWGSKFNGNISNWDVRNVKTMTILFMDSDFKEDISKWKTYNLECLFSTFRRTDFNGDISNWFVENVEDMRGTFAESKFNGDLTKWKPLKLRHRNIDVDMNPFYKSILEKDVPIWWAVIDLKLFESFEDFEKSNKMFDWIRGNVVKIERLETAVYHFEGEEKNIQKLKKITKLVFEK